MWPTTWHTSQCLVELFFFGSVTLDDAARGVGSRDDLVPVDCSNDDLMRLFGVLATFLPLPRVMQTLSCSWIIFGVTAAELFAVCLIAAILPSFDGVIGEAFDICLNHDESTKDSTLFNEFLGFLKRFEDLARFGLPQILWQAQ